MIDAPVAQYWGSKLIECLQRFGEQKTNSVLMALNGAQDIKPYQHYPQTAISFGDESWRTYYHCHHSPIQDETEHGHFHFFCKIKQQDDVDWGHVIALSMDQMGQPLRFFTTNKWVTDGAWLLADTAEQHFNMLQESKDDGLANSWFKYILLFFKHEILTLLQQRDAKINSLYADDIEQCFLDRSVYALSDIQVNLNQQFMKTFQ